MTPMSKASEAQRRVRNRKLALITAFKAERGCAECGERDVRCLDLHHRDPADKHPWLRKRKQQPSQSMSALSFADLERELAKCIVLCANCHRKHHNPNKEG